MAIVLDGSNGITTNSGTVISASTIGVGGATPSTSGAGITFPATQSASSDANTLDDYEEGTWTPTVGGTSTLGTASYATQTGIYTKIGRIVHVSCWVNWSSATGTGALRIFGLPFTGNSNAYQGMTMSGVGAITGNTSGNVLFARIEPNTSSMLIKAFGTGTTVNDGDLNVCATGILLFTGVYST